MSPFVMGAVAQEVETVIPHQVYVSLPAPSPCA